MRKNISSQFFKNLAKNIPLKRFSTDEKDHKLHSKDKSFHNPSLPDIVIWPINTKEVSIILKLAYKDGIPVTAWGGGSSLEGNPIPVKGGIILDLRLMNRILKIMPEDLQARVQPGITGEELDKELFKYGLWLAAAPGSKHLATIGGMIANNAGGMHAVKYGVMKDAVLELEIVTANGDILRTGSRSFKSVSGYDIKSLFIGSEGTLGIITETVLKLTPLPEAKTAILVSFERNIDIAKTNLVLLKTNIKPASIEFMDKEYIKLVNKAKESSLKENPTLLIELHGNKNIILSQLSQIQHICKTNGAIYFEKFETPEQLILLWEYRRAVRPLISKLLPDKGVLSAEVGVPVSKITELLDKAETVSKKYQLQTIMFGHMGDGNFHGWALYDLNNIKSWESVVKLNEEIIKFAISLGGTTTGEHGLGIGKSKFLPIEHPSSIFLMKSIKKLLDPKGILNPGKMFVD